MGVGDAADRDRKDGLACLVAESGWQDNVVRKRPMIITKLTGQKGGGAQFIARTEG